MAERPKHLYLTVEVPAMYVADLEKLRDELGLSDGETESDFILNAIGQPGIVKLTTEVSGEKDSDVITVWGSIRSAALNQASRGYGDGPHLTEEQLEEHGLRLEDDLEEAIGSAVDRLLAGGIVHEDICDDLKWQLVRIRKKAAK